MFSEPFALPVIDPPRNALPLPPRLIDTLPLERVHAILGRHFEGLIKRFSVDDTEEEEVVEQENATSPRPSESSDTEAGGGGSALSDSESSEALASGYNRLRSLFDELPSMKTEPGYMKNAEVLRELKIVMAELILSQRTQEQEQATAHHHQQPLLRLLSPATRSSVFVKTRQAFEGIIPPRQEPKQLQLDALLSPRQSESNLTGAKKQPAAADSGDQGIFEKIVR